MPLEAVTKLDFSDPGPLLDRLVEGMRGELLSAIKQNFARAGKIDATPDLSPRNLRSLCGLAQSLGLYALENSGFNPKPVATQPLPGFWQGHVALTLEFERCGAPELYLVDPTFGQFETPDHPARAAAYLRGKCGSKFMDSFLRKGWTKMTPESSLSYLDSFCRGRSGLKNAAEAFSFLKDPPASNSNYSFTRCDLAEKGLRIPDL
ncbi:MAG: hypothetical protein HY370_05025 [Proteobacteria bacterium]|nr:hypothetical protein [Pseudomonadota bacterium]